MIAVEGQDLASRQAVFPMSRAPLAFYPLFQQRAGYQRENFYASELAAAVRLAERSFLMSVSDLRWRPRWKL